LYQLYLQICFPSYRQQAVCICKTNPCLAILPSLEKESVYFTVSLCLKNLRDLEADVFSKQAQNDYTTCQKNIQYLLKMLHSCSGGLFLGLNLAELHSFMLYMLNILGNKNVHPITLYEILYNRAAWFFMYYVNGILKGIENFSVNVLHVS